MELTYHLLFVKLSAGDVGLLALIQTLVKV